MRHSADTDLASGSRAAEGAPTLSPGLAVATLGAAALLAVAGDRLLAEGVEGIGLALWVIQIAAAMIALAWRADLVVPRETASWLTVAVVCAACVAWRDAEVLVFFNFCGAVGALLLAATSLNRPGSVLLAPRISDAAIAVVSTVRSAMTGFPALVFREAPAHVSATVLRGRVARFARAAVIVVVLLVVFGALLRSADPIFASLVSLPTFAADELIGHTIAIAFLTIALGGSARAALLPKQTRATGAPLPFFRLTSLELNAGLLTLNVLFAVYVLAQFGWFFGGERFLHERTGLTAAEYARSGFFQMVWVVALVVPVLVATRAALEPGRALARRHTLLALPIVALLAVMIVSAALRMRLYVHYFGLSVDRLYPMAVMAWLTFVLVWMSVTVLRNWGRPFLAGSALSALATLMTLNVASPDRIVARTNLDRAANATREMAPLDLLYLTQLSGDALDLSVGAVLEEPRVGTATAGVDATARCESARHLLERWGPTSARRVAREVPAAWRTWNAGMSSGLGAVGAHSAELRRLAQTCPRVPAPAPAPTVQR